MTRDAAIERAKYFREFDPFFNDIDPALLNSAHVSNYIRTIGMVWPFEPDNLSGVTLSLTVGDLALYWDEEKKKIRKEIKVEKEFVLKSNTIVYVSIGEELRLPEYIIARFNLRVTNAYKGLLLGTGPIVDPRFEGKLFIPLHNLTNNDYIFYHGDTFIEMEFTKLSRVDKWKNPPPNIPDTISLKFTDGVYKVWKPKSDKIKPEDRDIDYYLRKANSGGSINSSLPSLKQDTKEAIDKATKTSEKVETSLSRFNVGLLFSFAALLTAIVGIVNVFRGDIKEIKEKKFEERIEVLEKKYDSLLNSREVKSS